jgi:hypothetical protein
MDEDGKGGGDDEKGMDDDGSDGGEEWMVGRGWEVEGGGEREAKRKAVMGKGGGLKRREGKERS